MAKSSGLTSVKIAEQDSVKQSAEHNQPKPNMVEPIHGDKTRQKVVNTHFVHMYTVYTHIRFMYTRADFLLQQL